jgi:cyclophilin family peptidyl-prolyl cis-trans isomerase
MSAKSQIILTTLVGSLVLVGAGCASTQYAIPANRMNSESALSGALQIPPNAQQQPVQPAAPAQPAADSAETDALSVDQGTRPPRPAAFPGILPAAELSGKQAVITTDKGTIVFQILDSEGPRAASNFIALARSGFYDGLTFHRVVSGFVIQGGDPLGNGTGGPGYKFEDDPVSRDYDAGIVAMANAGPNTNGSQFFIVTEDQSSLPKAYSIFGLVTRGLDVVRHISVGDIMNTVVIEEVK